MLANWPPFSLFHCQMAGGVYFEESDIQDQNKTDAAI
jgi:hypothetical protein